jgi:hypothetical protein
MNRGMPGVRKACGETVRRLAAEIGQTHSSPGSLDSIGSDGAKIQITGDYESIRREHGFM